MFTYKLKKNIRNKSNIKQVFIIAEEIKFNDT